MWTASRLLHMPTASRGAATERNRSLENGEMEKERYEPAMAHVLRTCRGRYASGSGYGTYGIKRTFKHTRRDEKGIQDPLQTLALGSGSCRDFAMLMIEAVRSLGIAARFVSGYLRIPDDSGDGHADAGNTHAWAQIYLPGPGWVDFDPSNGIIGNRDLVRVAVVHDPRQAVPLHGTWTGFPSDYLGMDVEVVVTSDAAKSEDANANFATR
jgi:transglutaminase-like putative cysteine protease